MFLFSSFHDDLSVSILSNWCPTESLAKLDTSICNKTERKPFLSVLKHTGFTLPWEEGQWKFYQWVQRRSIKLMKFECLNEIRFISLHKKCFRLMDFSRVESIKLNDLYDLDHQNIISITKLVNSCINLRSLSCIGCYFLTDDLFSEIINISQLTDIQLDLTPNFTCTSIAYITQHCSNLKSIHFNDADFSASFEGITELIQHNRNTLESIILERIETQPDGLFPAVAQCSELIELFVSCSAHTATDILPIIATCEKLSELRFVNIEHSYEQELGEEEEPSNGITYNKNQSTKETTLFVQLYDNTESLAHELLEGLNDLTKIEFNFVIVDDALLKLIVTKHSSVKAIHFIKQCDVDCTEDTILVFLTNCTKLTQFSANDCEGLMKSHFIRMLYTPHHLTSITLLNMYWRLDSVNVIIMLQNNPQLVDLVINYDKHENFESVFEYIERQKLSVKFEVRDLWAM